MHQFILFVFIFFHFAIISASEVILITGASKGIGLATAELLVRDGYKVYAGARKISSADKLLTLQEQFPNTLFPIQLDVTDEKTIQNAVETILQREGKIDVLINNAGVGIYGTIENVTINEAKEVFDINFFGTMRMAQAVLPTMREKNKGRIIQVSSRSGFRPHPVFSVYAASKFALEGLSETMAVTLKPWNIFVSLIEPGPVNTSFDALSPYGTKLPRAQDIYGSRISQNQDPFYPIFDKAGFFDPTSPYMQEPEEIASIIKRAIEDEQPLLRYQTSDLIRKQADERLVDITGLSSLKEWNKVLYPN